MPGEPVRSRSSREAGEGVAVAAGGVVRPEAFAASYSVPGAGLSLGVLFLVAASRLLAAHSERPLPAAVATAEWLSAVLYSAKSLNLTAPGVRETACRNPDAAHHYRYTELKLILRSGSQYFLLPVRWHKADGTAVILPRTDALRLEFTAAADAPC
ncbi:hypothetical protein [Amycolatopsis sp. MtRt-6]|uniref:hypothetical protein n=1 Tax=Amycolatopsis sp. MtRt-6 TaxID=2792782 RepID=UPI001A8C770C|nr:hypothetical protein [Amycolatopsis sp. MtRt-6]